MKKWGKKYWKQGIMFFVVFIVAIPAAINWLFKQHTSIDFFVAEWKVGDALSFYGSILASVATIIGVYLSIEDAQLNYREDARNRIRPYLALSHMHIRTRWGLLKKECVLDFENNREDVYEEYRLNKVYIIVSKDGIEYKTKLNNNQQQLVEKSGLIWTISSEGYILKEYDYVSLPFEIENVGNGAAIGFKLGFFSKGSDVHKGADFYTIKTGEKIYFHIFSEFEDESIIGDYVLDLWYRDIEGTRYSQKYPIKFERNSETEKVTTIFDFTGTQQIVKEECYNG